MKKIKLVFLLLMLSNLLIFPIFVVDARSNRSYDDLVEAFMDLASDYPELVSYESIGLTVDEHEIMMFKIGNPIGDRIVFDGAIHGWENVGSEVLFLYARWLLTSGEPIAEDILGRSYTLLIPALNIDNYNDSRKNSNGVDLNRNFAAGWDRSGSDVPSSEYYHGSSPVSEPESQALIRVFQNYRPKFYVTLHEGGIYYAGSTYGNMTYYGEIVDKVNDFAQERDVKPYYYQGEFRGSGLSIGDAANMGIMSFINELHDPHVQDNTETDVFPRFMAIAVVLGQECSVDIIPPTTTHSYDGLWHSRDFVISLSAQDYQSGVGETYYRFNGGSTKILRTAGQPLINVEGANNILEYWSVDNQGNEEIHKTLTGIKLDKTIPTIILNSSLTDILVATDKEIEISVNAMDSLSGIERVTLSYSINNQTNRIYLSMKINSTSGLYEASIPAQEEGTLIRIQIETYDNAGNKKVENTITIPEFPAQTILPICLIISLLIILIKKKKLSFN